MSTSDELRSMAVSVGLDMPQAATLMMGAADAIDRINDENAKLRELIKELYTDMWDSGEWLEPYEQRMRNLKIEV